MSEPREPCFEDDFDCDTDPPEWSVEEFRTEFTLEDIAIDKAHAYAQEGYGNDSSYRVAKNAYQDGFLAGFAFRMGGGHEGG